MKKPSIIKRIFSFLLRVCVVLALMAVIAVGSFEGVTYYLTGSFASVKKTVQEETGSDTSAEASTQEKADTTNTESVLLFVEDADANEIYSALTMYNKETHAMDMLLIPCDAQVTVGKDLLKEIQKTVSDATAELDLDEVARAFGEEKYAITEKIMEDVTGIDIAGYQTLTKKNFLKLLNVAGKVTYSMDHAISYRDSESVLQTIEKGEVSLDSEQGYALMTYEDGTDAQESDRLERSSTYLGSFFENLLRKNAKTVAKKYDALLGENTADSVTSTETVLKKLTADALTIRIMQGSEAKGMFTIDSQKVKLQITTLLKQADAYGTNGKKTTSSGESTTAAEENTTDETDGTSAVGDYSVELYNAAYVSGLAAEWETYLQSVGYNISLVDSYQDEGPISQTRIYVTEEGIGDDLLTYFPDADITQVDSISTGGDIQVFIGTDSTNVPAVDDTSLTTTEDETDDGMDDTSDEYSFDEEQ